MSHHNFVLTWNDIIEGGITPPNIRESEKDIGQHTKGSTKYLVINIPIKWMDFYGINYV